MERIRKVNVENLSDEQIKDIEKALSAKVLEITNKAMTEANRYLNVYGFEAKMLIQFNELKSKEKESLKQGKTRRRN